MEIACFVPFTGLLTDSYLLFIALSNKAVEAVVDKLLELNMNLEGWVVVLDKQRVDEEGLERESKYGMIFVSKKSTD